MHLGWTVMGKMKIEKERLSPMGFYTYMLVTILSKIFGIKILSELNKKMLFKIVLQDMFQDMQTEDMLAQHVFKEHPLLSNCRKLAERSLKNGVRSLEQSKNLGKYEAVFKMWLDEDIIRQVINETGTKIGNYLPHHLVYKDDSTTKIIPVFDLSVKGKHSYSINQFLKRAKYGRTNSNNHE
ncbi:uncharacterized protein TNCV_1924751 [Trichonephila clavipes]|nr:uncharacterized protein TNCV_1924751 [Trichonephila clavipes]